MTEPRFNIGDTVGHICEGWSGASYWVVSILDRKVVDGVWWYTVEPMDDEGLWLPKDTPEDTLEDLEWCALRPDELDGVMYDSYEEEAL